MIIRDLVGSTNAISGWGLHHGHWCQIQLSPAPDAGLRFLLGGSGVVRVGLDGVSETTRRTVLGSGKAAVSTVEHLLAALALLGIWDAEIHVLGDEVPALDGSAAPFIRNLLKVSSPPRWVPHHGYQVVSPFSYREGRQACHFTPSTEPVIECEIQFGHPQIGHQHTRLSTTWPIEHLLSRFARARTFGFLEHADDLRRRGLARGASFSNTLVMASKDVLNPGGLRYADEPVRHKALDVLGDLALLGGGFSGRIRAVRAGHQVVVNGLRHAVARGSIVPCPNHR